MKKNLISILIFTILLFSFKTSKSQENIDLNTNYQVRGKIYEIIDIDDMQNYALRAKINPINRIIYEAATIGRKGITIKVYKDTTLTTVYKKDEVLKIGASSDTFQYQPDINYPDFYVDTVVYSKFNPESIIRFAIIEDSLSDNEGNIRYEIKAIAPLIEEYAANTLLYEKPMFWLNFEELKQVLSLEPFVSKDNMDGRLKYDFYFDKRKFVTQALGNKFRFTDDK
ncbi:MAG: hypothetical protein U9R42_12505 [Bacteroidota bacterium]|nr:hypothetical protein [Bacteroidota bacterium]